MRTGRAQDIRRGAHAAVAATAAMLLAGTAHAQTAPWPNDPPQPAATAPAPWPGSPPPQQGGGAWPSSPPRPAMAPSGPMSPVPPQAGPGGGGGEPPCMAEFTKFRSEADKRGAATKAGIEKKVPREEVCKLFQGFATALGNWAKFTQSNASKCGIPPTIVEQLKKQHAVIASNAQKACATGPAAGGGPAPPTLSEALGTSRPSAAAAPAKPGSGNTGYGTLNTLTGSTLAR